MNPGPDPVQDPVDHLPVVTPPPTSTVTDRQERPKLAATVGPVGLAALGFGGSAVIEVSRLLDSSPVRQLVIDEPQRDLAAIVSDQLYTYVFGEGYPGLAADEFQPTEAQVKTFCSKAWLWRP